MPTPHVPVIIAVGEITERPDDPANGREPVALMAAALHAAEDESTVPLLNALDSIDLVGSMTWRYRDPIRRLCDEIGITPARAVNASMGGETPVRLVHEAALRIAQGKSKVAAVIGGEALHTLRKARAARTTLDWTPLASRNDMVRNDAGMLAVSRQSKRAGVTDPVHIYPLYENAWQAARGLSPADELRRSAALWARYAQVAGNNSQAWIRDAIDAERIATIDGSNRLIAFPYPKLMTANPLVNQAGAVILANLEWAREAGISEERLIFIWGGAAAEEPADYLNRDRYDHSPAQDAVLERAVVLAGGDAAWIAHAEIYSCFPIVPKLAAETLKLREEVEPTVAGGLTFFGGPINNYMTHGICAMIGRLRANTDDIGLVYGQGGVMNKHHALILSAREAPAPLEADFSVQQSADERRGPVPEVIEEYTGPATVETYTVIYARDGSVSHGAVVARTPDGRRLIAKVRREDEQTLDALESWTANAVGRSGHVRIDGFNRMVWEDGPLRDRRALPRRWCMVERDGPITLVTINRPEAMNALHPLANEELGEVFDDFAADPDQWVAILTGAGDRAFSAGNDLKFTAEAMARGERLDQAVRGFGGLTRRWDLTKPVISAVNGVAMGGGFEIALACDLVIAAETATFALPEPKVGLAALEGGLLRLPRQIGLKHAMGMILTGRAMKAHEGLALGFVNEVVSQGDLLPAARRWANEIIKCSPMSVRASKDAVLRGLAEPDLRSGYSNQTNYPGVQALFRSDDVREGPLAFAQKRAPRWKGR